MTSRLPSPLLRNVLAVASGTAMSQVVVFLFSPLITRIYSPEVFGLQGIFLSLVSILSPIIALRYPMAIITAETDEEMLKLARLSILVAAILACSFWILLVAGGQPLFSLLGAEGLGSLIFFLPLALFCVALQDVTNYRAARLGLFRLVGVVSVIQAFITNLARVLGGLASPVAAILVTITSLAPSIDAAIMRLGSKQLRRRATGLTLTEAGILLKQHRVFPIYRMPTDVLNAASQAVPVILLAALFSPAAAGLYVLTRSVLNLPINIIGSAVGNVLYARFAEMSREGASLLPLLLRSTGALLAFAPIIIGLSWFAPPVFAYVFGEEWRESGNYAQWMALWIALMLSNVPSTRTLPVIRRQGFALFFNFALFVVRVGAVIVAWYVSSSALTAIAWYSLLSSAMILLSIFSVIFFVAQFDRDQINTRHKKD